MQQTCNETVYDSYTPPPAPPKSKKKRTKKQNKVITLTEEPVISSSPKPKKKIKKNTEIIPASLSTPLRLSSSPFDLNYSLRTLTRR
jgi:hypothetical protein